MKCSPICGSEMVALMLDVGYAEWFCLDCENRRVIEAEGYE